MININTVNLYGSIHKIQNIKYKEYNHIIFFLMK